MYRLAKLGLHAVVHLFRVEEYQQRIDPVLHRADADGSAVNISGECVAEYPGYSERVPAEWRSRGVYVAIDSGGYPGCELRNLWPGPLNWARVSR